MNFSKLGKRDNWHILKSDSCLMLTHTESLAYTEPALNDFSTKSVNAEGILAYTETTPKC